ncbi:hypothetical protein EV382_0748 [Micromonospora violae]|uniref:Uncharacterized protein n=1 Tax=Micromonospora violae TaxID=1278207 RepID=A0A4Q7UDR7_9ACTN|nr:hypothetical protein EV382_0748 [Micromonospora violae]
MVTLSQSIVNKPYSCLAARSPGRVRGMDPVPLADATSAADIPGVRLLGLVVGALLLLAAIRAMFGRR